MSSLNVVRQKKVFKLVQTTKYKGGTWNTFLGGLCVKRLEKHTVECWNTKHIQYGRKKIQSVPSTIY